MSMGEAREAIYNSATRTWVEGDVLATQGKIDCRDVRCTRRDGKCVGWHCPHCGQPCSSQGHDCPKSAP